MNRLTLLLASCLLPALGGAESTPAPESAADAAWTLTPAYVSQYFFRGARLAGDCLQPAVDYTTGPLSVGVWSSFALADHVGGDADPEVDFYGAYTYSFRDDTVGIVPGFTLYTYPDADRANGLYRVTFEPSLAVNYTTHGVRFTPKLYYDTVLEGATWELSAAFAVPLTALGTELDFTATAGTFRLGNVAADTDPAVKNWGDYWLLGVAVPVQVNARTKVTLGLTYSDGGNNYYKQGTDPREANASVVGRLFVSLGCAITL